MTVLTDMKPEVVFDVTVGVEAEMLIRTYVPEYDPRVMPFQEAVDLAVLRDEMAAAGLEASVMANLNAEDPAEDGDAVYINALLDAAARADKVEREANGPWEVLTS